MINLTKTITIDQTTRKALKDFYDFYNENFGYDDDFYDLLDSICNENSFDGFQIIITE